MTDQIEILDDVEMEHIGKPAEDVLRKTGQSVASVREQVPAEAHRRAMTPMEMVGRALEMGVSADILKQMMDLRDREEQSQARKAFDEAMAAAKAEIPTIRKNRVVDFTSSKGRTHYKHEDLAEIARTVNPILGKHGLSYRFRTTSVANEPISVTCVVTHRLGYFEENTLVGPRDDSGNKNSLQQVGSTLTYLQRMTLKAALGLAAAEDDDARASAEPGTLGAISPDQVKAILALCEEVECPTDKFCQWAKIDAVPELPAVDFDKAVQVLEMRRRKSA